MHQGSASQGPPSDGLARVAGGGGGGGGAGAGCISELPDIVLYRILSFLKAWEVVRTSILSRRWRDLWATAPCLDIRQPCVCDARVDQLMFDEFIKNLLLKRRVRAPLDTLRLCWSHDGDANTWISYAVRRGARVIELSGKHHRGSSLPAYTSFISDLEVHNLKILKFTHILLDSNTLTQLCSRCTSLEELELKDCFILGTEIRSTSLKRLPIIKCTIPSGLLFNAPNLVMLCCIRPFSHVPQIENLESLVTATLMLDDSCLRHDRKWPQEDDDDDESDHDDDYFAYAGAEDPDDTNGSESDHDDYFAYAGAEDPDDTNGSESDHKCDGGDHYDSERSESSDSKGDDLVAYDDRTVPYGKIAHEYSSKIGPTDDSGGGHGSNYCIIYGGDGILHGLSNVRTMALLAHRGEVLLRRELEKCPKFKNLKTLSLGEWCMAPDFDALSTILDHSPNLENLFLHLDMAYDSREGIYPMGRSFACRNLKMVEISCSKDDIMVHKLAQFFIANGVPLEKIFARWTTSTFNGKEGRGSSAKRKAQGEAARRAAKQRKAWNSRSPERGKGGRK